MTGRELYELYQQAHGVFGERQLEWLLLQMWEQKVWDDLAKKVKEIYR